MAERVRKRPAVIPVLLLSLGLLAWSGVASSAQEPGEEGGVIAGEVLSGDGEPVSGATARVAGTGLQDVTDREGAFRLEGVPPGDRVLVVEHPQEGHAMERVDVRPDAVTHVTMALAPIYAGDELVVSAGPEGRARARMAQPVQVLAGRELRDRAGATLGETLADEPGVTSSYFGPGSGRPVIRGLGGDRVRVLENGLDFADTSDGGPDHAVPTEAALTERIEIVRGPATLLYGGSAIGGVVNVVDGRIPSQRPAESVTGTAQVEGGSVSDDLNASASGQGALGPFALHVEGFVRSTADYNVPSEAARDEGHDHGHAYGSSTDGAGFRTATDSHGHADEREGEAGTLENSAVETTSGAVGVSYVGASGHLGVSWSSYRSEYGVPGHSHGALEGSGQEAGHGHGEEGVVVDLERWSLDLEGERRFDGGPFRTGRVRLGYSDREDLEVEGGVVGTSKTNERWEARLEAAHREWGRLEGTWGVQFGSRDFTSAGIEAFVPPTSTDTRAVFALERFEVSPSLELEVGGRWEERRVENLAEGTRVGNSGLSFSAGGSWELRDGLVLALSGARSLKLPSAEELFSDGPHLATHQFEVGNPELGKERGLSLDATVRAGSGPLRGEVTGFVQDFDDFIFLEDTDEEELGLPVLVHQQADARFRGLEVSAEVEAYAAGDRRAVLDFGADYVRADLTDSGRPLPRIPPLQATGAVSYEQGGLRARVALRHTSSQDRVGAFEEPTSGFRFLDASVGFERRLRGTTHEITLRGTNLTDQFGRSHVSFLRDEAPLPGRDLRLTYRVRF